MHAGTVLILCEFHSACVITERRGGGNASRGKAEDEEHWKVRPYPTFPPYKILLLKSWLGDYSNFGNVVCFRLPELFMGLFHQCNEVMRLNADTRDVQEMWSLSMPL